MTKRCKAQQRAYEGCIHANKDRPEVCKDLDVMLTTCLADRIDPQAAAAFNECVQESFAIHKSDWAPDACDKQVQAMRESLKAAGLYPLPVHQSTKQKQRQGSA